MGCEIITINDTTWRMEDGMVRFFLLAGTASYTEEEMRGNRIRVYNMGYATFLCDPE